MPQSTTPRKVRSTTSPKKRALLATPSPRRPHVSTASPRTRAVVAAASPRTRGMLAKASRGTFSLVMAATSHRTQSLVQSVPIHALWPTGGDHTAALNATGGPSEAILTRSPGLLRNPKNVIAIDALEALCWLNAVIVPMVVLFSKCNALRRFCSQQVHDIFYNGLQEPLESVFNQGASPSPENSDANDLTTAGLEGLSGFGELLSPSHESVQSSSPFDAANDDIETVHNTDDEESSSTEQISSPLRASAGRSTPSSQSISPLTLQKKKVRSYVRIRARATKGNPIYGVVKGVKKGNKDYALQVTYRMHKLPLPRSSARDVSRRYNRQVNKLLQRCEDLSTETGCWLYFGAQHTTAREGAISYVSPRFCREAREQAERIATDFNTTAAHLSTARRVEAVQLSEKLAEVERQRRAAEASFQEAQATIAEYKRRLGI
ncbi:hypothetical protein CVT26_001660 [Gymnopilus dilepis]|uniref:Uncharacterized protein n=1 Tax=Gymnopilus dilepis TaxID=231916 RepID=A0A409YX72_9AGAR|nr:hypothetical protein CVT26_001660 [Gymnopilus dilepis]